MKNGIFVAMAVAAVSISLVAIVSHRSRASTITADPTSSGAPSTPTAPKTRQHEFSLPQPTQPPPKRKAIPEHPVDSPTEASELLIHDMPRLLRTEIATAMERLQRSGRDAGSWTTNLTSVFQHLGSSTVALKAGLELSDIECYAAGCVATATAKNEAAYTAVARSLFQFAEFRNWPASKFVSGAQLDPSGLARGTWIIYKNE